MRYWDSSAIVPLLVEEPGSPLVRQWLSDDTKVATWALSRVEIASAIEQRARDGSIRAGARRELLARLETLSTLWDEVTDLSAVRARAARLLALHPLRAADAVQLAAAALVREQAGVPVVFVCLDHGLAAAAEREGLPVLTWPDEAA